MTTGKIDSINLVVWVLLGFLTFGLLFSKHFTSGFISGVLWVLQAILWNCLTINRD